MNLAQLIASRKPAQPRAERFPAFEPGKPCANTKASKESTLLAIMNPKVSSPVPVQRQETLHGEIIPPTVGDDGTQRPESPGARESHKLGVETPSQPIHLHIHVHESPLRNSLSGMFGRAKETARHVETIPNQQPRIESRSEVQSGETKAPLLADSQSGRGEILASDADQSSVARISSEDGESQSASSTEISEYVYPETLEEEPEEDESLDDVDAVMDERFEEALALQQAASSILDGVNFKLDPSQEAAIRGLALENHGCLIGAAGTGKTTTTKVLVHTLLNGNAEWGVEALRLTPVNIRKYHERVNEANKKRGKKVADDDEATIIPSIAMVAFTGQATQVLKRNMPRAWAKNVMTIHLLLGFAPATYMKGDGSEGIRFEPTYTKYNKMPWDIILIDETSMVSVDLWHQLLDATKPGCRFYFVGDLNQLPPPIGAGILGFALSQWPVFELTVVHRQADDAANRIVDTAHAILAGRMPTFDNDKVAGWRVAGFKLDMKSDKAHEQIVRLAKLLTRQKVDPTNPESESIYNPYRDRIMVPMNGENEERPNYMLGQIQLNQSLATIFAKDKERIIIDAKRTTKKFAVGYRVMATKNEPPGVEDRVTNGTTGRITNIVENPKWLGDRLLVGKESEVKVNRALILKNMESRAEREHRQAEELGQAIDGFHFTATVAADAKKESEEEKQGGPASHIITVEFDNGATRDIGTNAQVEAIQIAYASTVHKAQGAEMPMAIVVIHENQKQFLTRELFYTAVTRASKRCLILYTERGLQIALRTQKIVGNNLAEKIKAYEEFMSENGTGFLTKRLSVRLSLDDESQGEWVEPEEDEMNENGN